MTHLLLALAALAAPVRVSSPARPSPVEVSVGYEQLLHFSNLTRVALGNDRAADVKLLNDGQLLLLGREVGRTTLMVWTGKSQPETYEVIVRSAKVGAIESGIHEVVADSTGLKVNELNGRIVISGEVYSAQEYALLHALVGEDIVWMVALHPAASRAVVKVIDEALAAEGFHAAHARLMGDRVVLEGQVQDDAERARAQVVADSAYSNWQKSAR